MIKNLKKLEIKMNKINKNLKKKEKKFLFTNSI